MQGLQPLRQRRLQKLHRAAVEVGLPQMRADNAVHGAVPLGRRVALQMRQEMRLRHRLSAPRRLQEVPIAVQMQLLRLSLARLAFGIGL